MVGREVLDLVIGVRAPASELQTKPALQPKHPLTRVFCIINYQLLIIKLIQ